MAPPSSKSEEGGGDPLQAGARLALAKALRDHFEGGLSDKPELVADAVDLVYHVQLRVELAELMRAARAGAGVPAGVGGRSRACRGSACRALTGETGGVVCVCVVVGVLTERLKPRGHIGPTMQARQLAAGSPLHLDSPRARPVRH